MLRPFSRFCIMIGAIPESIIHSLSYEQQLLRLINFLKTTVIPAIGGNTTAIKAIEEWIENVDLQEFVDEKLDEMVESGQLQEIISEYLNSTAVFGFETVEDMKSATNLINGSNARTLGFYNLNDGGGATYKIRTITNEDVVDNKFIIAMEDETLVAELIIENSVINVKQIGAVADTTVTDGHVGTVGTDNTEYFQSAIDKITSIGGGVVYVPNGNYAVGSLDIDTVKGLTIKGNQERYAGTNATLVTTSANTFNIQTPCYNFHLEDLNLISSLSQSTNVTKLINLIDGGYFQRCVFRDLTIANYKYALDLTTPSGNDFTDGAIFENINFRTVGGCIKAKHLEASSINCCSAEPFTEYFAYLIQTGGVSITNCIMRSLTTVTTNNTYGIVTIGTTASGRNVRVCNCLSEDIDCFALLSTPNTIIENCRYTINRVPRINPIILARLGSASATNTTLTNMIVNYEVETTVTNVLILNSNTSYSIDGVDTSFNNMQNTITYINGLKLSISGDNESRKWLYKGNYTLFTYNNARRVFYGPTSIMESATNPNGESWNVGDIVIYQKIPSAGQRHNHIIGSIYVQTGGSTYTWLPITVGVDSMTYSEAKNTYSGEVVGQISFDTTNNKPIWWNGTAWVYADGTSI